MSNPRYIPENLRRIVVQRANHCCEYCRIHEAQATIKILKLNDKNRILERNA
jgi:hypothetical protein